MILPEWQCVYFGIYIYGSTWDLIRLRPGWRKFQLRNSQFMASRITDQIRVQIQAFKQGAQALLRDRLGPGNRVEAHQHGQSNPPRFIQVGGIDADPGEI